MIAAIALALAAAPGPVALVPCDLDTPDMPRVHASCGSVTADDGVTVGFAVLAATGHKKKPDPLVLLPGGPGQAATQLAGYAELMFAPFRKDRDVVLFDPRGTGRSHPLACPKRSVEDELAADDERDRAWLSACAQQAAAGYDLKSITTGRIARDLDLVRDALGVTSWNVAGISYGTRLALAYDRLFPGRARSLVLDGPVPFSMKIGEHQPVDARAALADIDARCRAVPGCEKRSLVDVARDLRRTLDEKPRDVDVPDPRTGKKRTIHVTGRTAVEALDSLLYAEETAALVPPLLAAADAGDLGPLASQVFLGGKMGDTVSRPMQLSVLCAEDVPFFDDAPAGDGPFFDARADLRKACAVWPHAEVPASFHDDQPRSPTPALVLTGTADPVTPPHNADDVKRTLPKATVLVAPGLGHNIVFRECIPRVVAAFLDAPGAAVDVDTCAKHLHPFPLFIDPMGPAP